MKIMEVKAICNNCMTVEVGGIVYVTSYNETIAVYDKNTETLVLGKKWSYSKTTLTHLFKFLESLDLKPFLDEIRNFKTRKAGMQYMIDKGFVSYDEKIE